MVITNAKVVLPTGVEAKEVRIADGKIAEIGDHLGGERKIDARGRYLLPSMVDIGVRVRDRKLRSGTLERLSKKAHAAGFGTLVLSSLAEPPIDDEITLEFVKSQAQLCRLTRIDALISGLGEGGKLSDCATLLKEGGVGIEFRSDIDGNLIRRLMEYAKLRGVHLFCRANDPALQGDGVMQEGEVSARLGLGGIPELAESSQVARIGEFAAAYEVPVVILHASTPRTLEICRDHPWLKAQVPLHHLLLDDTACDDYDTSAKLWPPLRSGQSREKMLAMLQNGEIDMLTSLHSPVAPAVKDAVFAEAAYGIDALTLFLPLLYTRLIREERISWPEAAALISTRAAETVGLGERKGKIETGYDADLLLFDPEGLTVIDDPASPYRGITVRGSVEKLDTISQMHD
ncbi:amidohydrolase family protein [Hydrogenimonas sp. SS33]|uniref:amidohydrolase family protein n=1 Tax=Hydrogenimonas leucolamina TaxID=2954236 RepID=UPI00336C08B7